jgi:transposase-like protein
MSDRVADTVDGLVVRASPKGGRRTYNAEAKRTLVRLCLQPGVSVAAMALTHGINANLLRRWIVQYSPELGIKPTSTPALLPVSASPSGHLSCASDAPDSFIEISFMDMTVRVRGTVDAQALRVVLDCVARRT